MAKKNKYTGKYVIVYDTICDGNQCVMTENEKGESVPKLFDSHDEAYAEIFDGAYSMLSNRTAAELKEYNEGVTKKMVKEMGEILKSGDIAAMKKFLTQHSECNDNEEWVEFADQFIMNRKTIFTGKGLQITGTKLK